MKYTNLFTLVTKYFVLVMPFYVIISLFLEKYVGVSFIGIFLKECMIVVLFYSLVYEYFQQKRLPKFDILDVLIFAFMIYGIVITLSNGLGIKSIIFGGRYDFMFLIVFLIFRHSADFLKISMKELLHLFLYSGAFALLVSVIFKFALGEKFLIEFGFVDYVGNWIYSGGVPNYHGLEGTGIKRFQGIFDGPNPMAYFLIFFSGIFLYTQKHKKEYYVILSISILFILLILTYSRSALLGVGVGVGLLFLLDFKRLFIQYKTPLIVSISFFILLGASALYLFQDPLKNIFLRHGSTSGHFERMEIGFDRFLDKPLGAGLAEAGPGFRHTYPDRQTKQDEIYFIPESWYIQILIEGGVIYFFLFISILCLILRGLIRESKILFAMFVAILIMNVFLHIFEATYLSILLFIFIGLFLRKSQEKVILS